MARDEVAALAPMVSAAAADGDTDALAILEQAARELALMASALRDAPGLPADETVTLSWSGGVLTREATVRDQLGRRLEMGGFRMAEPMHPPGCGAAL
ncbi:hypothetical protein KX816_01460 [Sphingosinicellaceae bacterium]|nr:hypothetical protein KX816_01460 [Sphingosinicellaceae bacterium]